MVPIGKKCLPKGLNSEEKFQVAVFGLMRDLAELEKQLNTGKGISRFVHGNPRKAREIARNLAAAHKNIQRAALQISAKIKEEKQLYS